MAKTATIHVKMDAQLKTDVEEILKELHLSPSIVIRALYEQIRQTKSIPFKAKEPIFWEDLTPEELDAEIEKGLKDMKEGRVFTPEEVDAILKKDLGID